jgi:Outer membrane protein beta-barrel domain
MFFAHVDAQKDTSLLVKDTLRVGAFLFPQNKDKVKKESQFETVKPANVKVKTTPVDSPFVRKDSALPKKDSLIVGAFVFANVENDTNHVFSTSERKMRIHFNFKGKRKHPEPNVSTNWWVFDFGFTNFTDNTNYASADARSYARAIKPGEQPFSKADLRLIPEKSTQVNIWIFMTKINLYKHIINLKYGLGLETNNYRYAENISYKEGNGQPYIFRDSISFCKNKLSADYLTFPLLLNINTAPDYYGAFTFSIGASVGYLYSSRNKQVSDERGTWVNKGNYDISDWKFSLMGEMGAGLFRVYGQYSFPFISMVLIKCLIAWDCV